MRTSELEYDLPEERIAVVAAEPRDAARLMVVSRTDAESRVHRVIRDLPEFLRAGDLLVFNTTKVIPARLEGRRVDSGGRVSGLYLGLGSAADRWVVMLRGSHLRAGLVVAMEGAGEEGAARVEIVLDRRHEADAGAWEVVVRGGGAGPETLERIGRTPLPPYILKARKDRHVHVADIEDRQRYQTVYADESVAAGVSVGGGDGSVGGGGSVAAPTAGLHFTTELLAKLGSMGVKRADVVLHVGTGTFKPIETERVEDHSMHGEWCVMPEATRNAILATRAAGGRVVCVGTTSARTVESFAGEWERGEDTHPNPSQREGLEDTHPNPSQREGLEDVHPNQREGLWMSTRLLIAPGYRWRWVDGLLTNFHLPRSTLLAMVGAMTAGGVYGLKRHYAAAVEGGYRFYSYGDAMLVV